MFLLSGADNRLGESLFNVLDKVGCFSEHRISVGALTQRNSTKPGRELRVLF